MNNWKEYSGTMVLNKTPEALALIKELEAASKECEVLKFTLNTSDESHVVEFSLEGEGIDMHSAITALIPQLAEACQIYCYNDGEEAYPWLAANDKQMLPGEQCLKLMAYLNENIKGLNPREIALLQMACEGS